MLSTPILSVTYCADPGFTSAYTRDHGDAQIRAAIQTANVASKKGLLAAWGEVWDCK